MKNSKEKNRARARQYYKDYRDKVLEYQKQYYLDNKDKISAYKKQYRQKNKEILAKKQKQRYEENKDKVLERNKQHYENNKDKILEQYKQYRQENREKLSEHHKQYYEKNKENMKSAIYQIKNIKNNKIYIGCSTQLERRWRTHEGLLKKGKHKNSFLQKEYDKYGKDVFVYSILKEYQNDIQFQDLEKEETRLILEKKQNGEKLYNISVKISSL